MKTTIATPIAKLVGASKSFGPVRAVDNLDLEIYAGELLSVLGPNGAGKTTAINMMLGVLRLDSGSVQLFGHQPTSGQARIRTGVMLQISGVPESLRVREHLSLFAGYYPNPMPLEEVVQIAGLKGLENRFFGKLSGGEKQRLMFALAIIGQPDLIFLDEPTVGLDVSARHLFWEQIRRLISMGRGVVLTTHYLEEADALADRIVVINKGRKIAEGTPAEIKGHGRGKTIRCRTRLSPEVLFKLTAVSSVQQDGPHCRLLSGNAEETVRQLLAADPTLSDLEVTGACLEEAFLSLTHSPITPEVAA